MIRSVMKLNGEGTTRCIDIGNAMRLCPLAELSISCFLEIAPPSTSGVTSYSAGALASAPHFSSVCKTLVQHSSVSDPSPPTV